MNFAPFSLYYSFSSPAQLTHPNSFKMSSTSSLKERLKFWQREYEFTTAIYLLEPWERRLVNVTMSGIAAVSLYACCYYLPHYARSFAKLLGF